MLPRSAGRRLDPTYFNVSACCHGPQAGQLDPTYFNLAVELSGLQQRANVGNAGFAQGGEGVAAFEGGYDAPKGVFVG